MDGIDSLCCCTGEQGWDGRSHRRTCAPKEPPALASPGPPLSCCCIMWISTIWIYVVVYACEHNCHTYLSLMCGRRCSEPAPHLAAPASHVSVEHQCPAPGWGSGPGGLLWAQVISEVSESAAAHVYWASTGTHLPFTWPWQTGCPLPGNQADAWRLVLSSKALFIRHSGVPGQPLGILYMCFIAMEIWNPYTHLDFRYLNPPWETAGFWLLASYHVLHSVQQILDCPSRWHATPIPQIKYSRINILVLNFSFSNLGLPYKLLALITWKKILIK